VQDALRSTPVRPILFFTSSSRTAMGSRTLALADKNRPSHTQVNDMLKRKAVWTDKPTAIREGEWVARWLNEPTTPERERIATLLRRIEIVLATPDTKAGSEEGFDEIRSANQTLGQYDGNLKFRLSAERPCI
jgi:hypothetical protein